MTKVNSKSVVNESYCDALMNIVYAMCDMFTHSNNKIGELYRLASLVGFFARQKIKIDALRAQLGEARENADIYAVKFLIGKISRSEEEKVFDVVWEEVASSYDKILAQFLEESHQEEMNQQFKTADEILQDAEKYSAESKKAELDKQLKLAEALLNFA